jgi:signal transduction histidine kinase
MREIPEGCRDAFERHVRTGDEGSLAQAHEIGRRAMRDGWTLLDLGHCLWRSARDLAPPPEIDAALVEERLENVLLECLSPYEMFLRGPKEASDALRRLEERREEDARRVAQALHDEAGQLLAAVHLALEKLRPHVAAPGGASLARAEQALRLAEEEIRRLSHELRPPALDDLGLAAALHVLARRAGQRAGLAVTVRCAGDDRLPAEVETALYRLAQEALNNTVRHAGASRSSIEVEQEPRDVTCRIFDDGRGFDPETRSAGHDGLGLLGMRERITSLDGSFEISSRPGAGTEIRVSIPLEVEHAYAGPDRR